MTSVGQWTQNSSSRRFATAESTALFPGSAFPLVAEDSARRFVATADDVNNPGGHKLVDAIWNFGYRDEIRRLVTNSIATNWGEPSRTARVQHLISKDGAWNCWTHAFYPGYSVMACSVVYVSSHSVPDEPRLMNMIL